MTTLTRPALAACLLAVSGLWMGPLQAVPACLGDAEPTIRIKPAGERIDFEAGRIGGRIGLRQFALELRVNGEPVVQSAAVELDFKGRRHRLDRVESHLLGEDWIELRGWVSREESLAWALRLQLHPQQAAVGAWFSVFDRHMGHPTDAQWHRRWNDRTLGPVEFRFEAPTIKGGQRLLQTSAMSGGRPGMDPEIHTAAVAGFVHWEIQRQPDGLLQLEHAVDASGNSHVEILPRREGRYRLALHQRPLGSPYPAANRLSVRIEHAEGSEEVVVDQGRPRNPLGEFALDSDSRVRLIARDDEGDTAVFGELELIDADGRSERIGVRRHAGRVAEAGGLGLQIPEFWQKHPIEAGTRPGALYWRGVLEPTRLAGGAGFSLDFGLELDRACAGEGAADWLAQPRARALPDGLHPIDAVMVERADYRQLLGQLPDLLQGSSEWLNGYGWKSWGDYLVGGTYFARGVPHQDWSGLQYDLGTGLLLAWLHTGDPALWQRARAAIRNTVDTQVAKYEPYTQKRSGAGLRKGACPLDYTHYCQEPIPEYNYHARALLLWAELSGEAYPREVAQMVIDNSAYFAHTRTDWLLGSSRPMAWTLRNLVYGAGHFPEGTRYNGTRESGWPQMPVGSRYETLLRSLLERYLPRLESEGGLPPDQPVWQGQVVEGLVLAADSGLLPEALAERTRAAALAAVHRFRSQQLRRQGNGWQMLYVAQPPEWTAADPYLGLWLTPMVWAWEQAGRPADPELAAAADWLLQIYLENRSSDPGSFSLRSPRMFSTLTSFPLYGLQRLHEAREQGCTPAKGCSP
ncbi:MAG: hypothetical protein MEQ07_09670 [Aquimonas sp.]|nr:hypothetical protein [Aquimonas sp.]